MNEMIFEENEVVEENVILPSTDVKTRYVSEFEELNKKLDLILAAVTSQNKE